MKYDLILFENFRAAFHHKYDVYLIARLLKRRGMNVAILNVYGEDRPEDYTGIDLLNMPIIGNTPNDKTWLECKNSIVKRIYYSIRFLTQQRRYMNNVWEFIEDKANSFYFGSYHLMMPSVFLGIKKPCYYWGLRSYRMTGFWKTFKSNPFLGVRMAYLKNRFLRNDNQNLFVSNEIIKREFIEIGIPENRLVIREERCIETVKDFNPNSKDKEFSLLVIGGLRRQKHIEITVRAFKEASLDNSLLRLVGENKDVAYEKEIVYEIGRCQNIERINSLLQYDEFNSYMTRAHFALFADEKQMSSVTNGTMMEAIINFTPIIAPDHEPYTYYVEKFGLGLTYKPGDVISYAETIKQAYRLGYEYFIDGIQRFQKLLEFDNVANRLSESLVNKE